MTVDGYLYRAQAALSALGYFTCYCSEDADMPPEDCGFGLSVILSHIEDDVRAAYNEITKPKKEDA
jgi:hypothetical protein